MSAPQIQNTPAGYRTPASESDGYLMEAIRAKRQLLEAFSNPHEQVKQQIEQLSWLIDHVRFFHPQRLPRSHQTGEHQACYQNAQLLALSQDSLIYVEGFGCRLHDFPHAWCVDAEGNVIDPTWHGRSEKCSAGTAYFGVPLTKSEVKKSIRETGFYDEVIRIQRFSVDQAG